MPWQLLTEEKMQLAHASTTRRPLETQKVTTADLGKVGHDTRANNSKGLAQQREAADHAGAPILGILGDPQKCVAFDRSSRSTPGRFAHVKHGNAQRPYRRSAVVDVQGEGFLCREQWEPCVLKSATGDRKISNDSFQSPVSRFPENAQL